VLDSIVDRFMDKVSPEPNSGCWLWTANLGTYGYGRMRFGHGPVDAHRISYRLFCGEIPEGKYVLHKCDVRPCVNPDHLFIGTHKDNMQHAVDHRRWPRGKQHWNVKLTEEQARRAKFSGQRPSVLAREFGCASVTIVKIRNGTTWKWLEND